MSKKQLVVLLLIVCLLFVAVAGCGGGSQDKKTSEERKEETSAGSQTPETVTLEAAGGGVGGAWYSTLASLAELINQKDPSIQIKVVPGGGVSNPASIGKGDVDMGWLYPPFAKAAYNGTKPYDQKYQNLRVIAGGFSPSFLEISVLADRDITSIEDVLKNKKPVRFLTGKKSTTTGWFFDRMLEYYGVTTQDIESWGGKVIYTAYGDWAQLAKDGHIDIMFNQIAIPSPVLQEILTSREVRLLPFPSDLRDFMAEEYSLNKAVIPAGSYSFLKEDIPTLHLSTALAVNKKVPDEVVYRLLEILDQNLSEVKAIHPSWKDFDIKTAWKNLGAPLHPGAEKFYKDKGYMK